MFGGVPQQLGLGDWSERADPAEPRARLGPRFTPVALEYVFIPLESVFDWNRCALACSQMFR